MPPNDPSSFTPSSKNKLLRLDWPFTDGYEKVPIGFTRDATAGGADPLTHSPCSRPA